MEFVKPDEFKLGEIKRIRFGAKADLWTGEADAEVAAKGLATRRIATPLLARSSVTCGS